MIHGAILDPPDDVSLFAVAQMASFSFPGALRHSAPEVSREPKLNRRNDAMQYPDVVTPASAGHPQRAIPVNRPCHA